MSEVKLIYPSTEEENAEATRLYEEGLAASGEDPQQGEEDEQEPKAEGPVNRLPKPNT